MTTQQNPVGTAAQINMDFFIATLCGGIGYLIWPSDPKWWGFGFISICLMLAALVLTFRAIRLMIKRYKRDKTLALYLAQGNKPKTSAMVSGDRLKRMGMTDD